MRQFQDLGHQVIFLIGDFTGMIGDPTGKNVTRKPLTREDVLANAETYGEQVFKVLDREKTEVRFNSEWFGKMGAADMIKPGRPAHGGAHARARRLRQALRRAAADRDPRIPVSAGAGLRLGGAEGDVELGGTDQKFNLLMGRALQAHYGQAPQIVLTMPLLEGLDGVNKMGKSLGNYIGINEPANDIFGKTMRIADDLMWRWNELLSFEIGVDRGDGDEGCRRSGEPTRATSSCAWRANWPPASTMPARPRQAIAGWHEVGRAAKATRRCCSCRTSWCLQRASASPRC